MERQRSFSIKSTRFLAFSFTISSSFIFLTYFSIWVVKSAPSFRLETPFQVNSNSSINLTVKPITVHTLSNFSRNFSETNAKIPILFDTHSDTSKNTSGFLAFSVVKGTQRKENNTKVVKDVPKEIDGAKVNDGITHQETAFPPLFQRSEEKKIRADSAESTEIPSNKNVEKKNINRNSVGKSQGRIEEKSRRKECDITKGRWVYDESYPLYTNGSCPFIDEGFNCMSNGRPDNDYIKRKWQPHDCDIPRFNATKMLEIMRGKRMIFVGDSINRNQWESMLCLLASALKNPKRVYETHGRRITKEKGNYSFRFVDYKFTVEYYVSHFLVHESKARVGQKRVQTLRIDVIDRGSSRWRGADILIFNTAHWWTHYKTKSGINYYQEENMVHPQLDVSTAYRRALHTWASWVDKHINPSKTQVFFRNSAPSHFRGGQWNSGGHCKEGTRPLNETLNISYPEKNVILEEILKQMKTRVMLLNITNLSGYRIDGHPSIYGKKLGNRYSSSTQDCSHWCLPGVPDTWNELLYYYLQSKQLDSL